MTAEEWQAGLRPLSTPALTEKLAGADPAERAGREGHRAANHPSRGPRRSSRCCFPLDAGGLRLELVASDDGWLVDVVDWERP